MASQSFNHGPPPGSEETRLSGALTTVFSFALLGAYVKVYHSCGGADKTLYEIITARWGGAAGQSCAERAGVYRKPILPDLTGD